MGTAASRLCPRQQKVEPYQWPEGDSIGLAPIAGGIDASTQGPKAQPQGTPALAPQLISATEISPHAQDAGRQLQTSVDKMQKRLTILSHMNMYDMIAQFVAANGLHNDSWHAETFDKHGRVISQHEPDVSEFPITIIFTKLDEEASFIEHAGFISEGGLVGRATMTVYEAKLKAASMPDCNGFTFEGQDSGQPVTIYFKNKFDLHATVAGWTSYEKVAKTLKVTFLEHGGFISEGGLLGRATMTVNDAKLRAASTPDCLGFTFEGQDAGQPMIIYFKNKFDLHANVQGWTSYEKVQSSTYMQMHKDMDRNAPLRVAARLPEPAAVRMPPQALAIGYESPNPDAEAALAIAAMVAELQSPGKPILTSDSLESDTVIIDDPPLPPPSHPHQSGSIVWETTLDACIEPQADFSCTSSLQLEIARILAPLNARRELASPVPKELQLEEVLPRTNAPTRDETLPMAAATNGISSFSDVHALVDTLDDSVRKLVMDRDENLGQVPGPLSFDHEVDARSTILMQSNNSGTLVEACAAAERQRLMNHWESELGEERNRAEKALANAVGDFESELRSERRQAEKTLADAVEDMRAAVEVQCEKDRNDADKALQRAAEDRRLLEEMTSAEHKARLEVAALKEEHMSKSEVEAANDSQGAAGLSYTTSSMTATQPPVLQAVQTPMHVVTRYQTQPQPQPQWRFSPQQQQVWSPHHYQSMQHNTLSGPLQQIGPCNLVWPQSPVMGSQPALPFPATFAGVPFQFTAAIEAPPPAPTTTSEEPVNQASPPPPVSPIKQPDAPAALTVVPPPPAPVSEAPLPPAPTAPAATDSGEEAKRELASLKEAAKAVEAKFKTELQAAEISRAQLEGELQARLKDSEAALKSLATMEASRNQLASELRSRSEEHGPTVQESELRKDLQSRLDETREAAECFKIHAETVKTQLETKLHEECSIAELAKTGAAEAAAQTLAASRACFESELEAERNLQFAAWASCQLHLEAELEAERQRARKLEDEHEHAAEALATLRAEQPRVTAQMQSELEAERQRLGRELSVAQAKAQFSADVLVARTQFESELEAKTARLKEVHLQSELEGERNSAAKVSAEAWAICRAQKMELEDERRRAGETQARAEAAMAELAGTFKRSGALDIQKCVVSVPPHANFTLEANVNPLQTAQKRCTICALPLPCPKHGGTQESRRDSVDSGVATPMSLEAGNLPDCDPASPSTMEIFVTQTTGLPVTSLLSGRVGTSRRQQSSLTKLRTQPLKFSLMPGSTSESLRLRVLHVRGEARLVLHPCLERYRLNLRASQGHQMSLTVCIRGHQPAAAASLTRRGCDAGDRDDPYLGLHSIEEYMASLLRCLAHEKVEDPVAFMRDQFAALVGSERDSSMGSNVPSGFVELTLVSAEGIQAGSILTLSGPVKAQASVAQLLQRPWKLPFRSSSSEPFKLGVLENGGETRLQMHPQQFQYHVQLPASRSNGEAPSIALHVVRSDRNSNASGFAAPRPGVSEQVADKHEHGLSNGAMSAHEYLEAHRLVPLTKELLRDLVSAKPQDPYRYLLDQLATKIAGASSTRDHGNAIDAVAAAALASENSELDRQLTDMKAAVNLFAAKNLTLPTGCFYSDTEPAADADLIAKPEVAVDSGKMLPGLELTREPASAQN